MKRNTNAEGTESAVTAGKAGKQDHSLPRFMRVRYDGRGILRLSALLLLILTGHELYARTGGIIQQAEELCLLNGATNAGFTEKLNIILLDGRMHEDRNLLIFAACAVILSLLCVILGNRPRAGYFLIPADTAVLCAGLILPGIIQFDFSAMLQWGKLIPLVLIPIGCTVNLIEGKICRRFRDLEKKEDQCDLEQRIAAAVSEKLAAAAGTQAAETEVSPAETAPSPFPGTYLQPVPILRNPRSQARQRERLFKP